MNTAVFHAALFLVIILSVQNQVVARPNSHNRMKRVSDPHLADLQTRVALRDKIRGMAITLAVAGGRDLNHIGRKRRSESRILETLFNQSEEDQGDPINRRFQEDNFEEVLYDYKK